MTLWVSTSENMCEYGPFDSLDEAKRTKAEVDLTLNIKTHIVSIRFWIVSEDGAELSEPYYSAIEAVEDHAQSMQSREEEDSPLYIYEDITVIETDELD